MTPAPRRLTVFVTVGMGPWPFDRLIGSLQRVCATHDVYPDCEMIRMDQVNEAYERLLKNDVRYRFVIDMATMAAAE